MPVTLLFGLASTVPAANMYYSYPVLLHKVADIFERALIPTLLQVGHGACILSICPLDNSRRLRSLRVGLISFALLIWTAWWWKSQRMSGFRTAESRC